MVSIQSRGVWDTVTVPAKSSLPTNEPRLERSLWTHSPRVSILAIPKRNLIPHGHYAPNAFLGIHWLR